MPLHAIQALLLYAQCRITLHQIEHALADID